MPKVTVNNITFEVDPGYTVLQTAQMVDTEIPVFCYHPKLAIAGNCRMCLVEVEKMPKLVASCAMPIQEGMVIRTNTNKVKQARAGVLEFLLKNHPLDCPICDQGGECDLQDITMAYGASNSRFNDVKRAVNPTYMGPLIRPYMTRCIQCTRCVRFGADIAGMRELGAVGRGETMEIVTFLDQAITSELSGNLVDVCPVGALTSKPYQFQGRPWELKKTNSIDVLDAVGSNIRVDSFNLQVKRILPRLNEDINEEWISDKTRYACDALSIQRLDQPYIKRDNQLQVASWPEALAYTAQQLKSCQPHEIAVLIGDLVDVETIYSMKKLCDQMGIIHYDCRLHDEPINPVAGRASYLFNTTIAGIEQADFCLIIGANVRADAAMVHARLRKRYIMGDFNIAYLGGKLPQDRDLCFDYEDLGDELSTLTALIDGTHPMCKVLKAAQKPILIIGQSALSHKNGTALYQAARRLAAQYNFIQQNWCGFNVLHTAASRVGALDLNFTPTDPVVTTSSIIAAAREGSIKILYLLGVDHLDFNQLQNTFMIYQGHHGAAGAQHADVILPGCAYTEKSALYVNTEGRVQQTCAAVPPPGDAKEDWKVIRALSDVLQTPLSFNIIDQLHAQLYDQYPHFQQQDSITPCHLLPILTSEQLNLVGQFIPETFDFYQRDIISAHSVTMAQCANAAVTGDHV